MGALLSLIPGVGPGLAFVQANWKLIVAGILAIALALFVLDWQHRGSVIAAQKVEISALNDTINTKNKLLDISKEGENLVARRLQEANDKNMTLFKLMETTRNAGNTNDPPVAPSLDLAVDALGGLLDARSKARTARP